MHIQQAVDFTITKLHHLSTDSAAFYGGLIGGGFAFFENVRIAEWWDFSTHAVIGGTISFIVKKVCDIAYQKLINRKKEEE